MKRSQILNNAKWIIICKIVQSLLQFIIGMLCARYLGPSNYGLINYAASFASFALPVVRLGLDATLVRELVKDSDGEGEIMGTSIVMCLVSSVLCYGGVVGFVTVANAGDTTVLIVCMLYNVMLFFAAIEMIQYWYQYKLLSKYYSLVGLVAYVIVSVYRIFLLVTDKSVYWFAVTNAFDVAIIVVSLVVIYLRMGAGRLRFSFSRARDLFSRSKHYILAMLMISIIQNTDHIMLTNMVGEKENGFYSAAITSAAVVQFVYYAIIDSFRPMILSKKEENEELYKLNMSRLYSVIIYLAFLQSVVFILFAKPIITILYGAQYAESIRVLRVLMMYYVFSLMGVVRNVWILAEQKQKYLLGINLSGALFNVVLNFFLIPYFGACGAAFASLMTQFFMNFLLGFIFKPIRESNYIMLRGLNPAFLMKESKNIVSELLDSRKKKNS
ncbi:MAG: flippase [Ruminococcus sp.]|nr:flippase [Ruminococcus sp.]